VSYDEWFRLLILALLYPSMVLAAFLLLYLLYRALGWLD
jgi:type IV secretory pathway VirB6-like protein